MGSTEHEMSQSTKPPSAEPGPPQLRSSLDRRIEELEAALENERRAVAGRIAHLERKVASCERLLRAMTALPNTLAPSDLPPLPSRAAVTAESQLKPEDGFYGLEAAASGAAFRWTGPSRSFFFTLLVNRDKPRRLTLKVMDFSLKQMGVSDGASAVGVRVDGENAKSLGSDLEGGGVLAFHYETLAAPGSPRPTHVEIISPRTWQPSAVDSKSSDTRHLGLAFHALSIGEAGEPR